MYVAGPVTENVTLSAAVGTRFPLASCTSATTNAASEPFAVHWNAEPSGLARSGTTLNTIFASAPAVVRVSLTPATGLPLASRHCAVTVPGDQFTIQCTCPGITVVFCARFVLELMFHGLGTWSASKAPVTGWFGWPWISRRTDGQLLKAFS